MLTGAENANNIWGAPPFKERKMCAKAVLPFKWKGAKSRLHPFLSVREREELALCMLKDVLHALSLSDVEEAVVIVRGDAEQLRENVIEPSNLRLEFREDFGELNEVLKGVVLGDVDETSDETSSERSERESRVLVMMSDLPLVRNVHINDVLRCDADIVIVPGRRGGTNAISLRNPNAASIFSFSCGISFLEHMKCAEKRGMSVCIYDSFFFSTDIDEVGDLIDLIVFGNGFASEYLRKIGVFISAEEHLHIARRPVACAVGEEDTKQMGKKHIAAPRCATGSLRAGGSPSIGRP
ncbi:MAG: 2-phospho-L-lactate guanylyltransferase [Canidatus Methanoxibalbensis ujae]|nr:2-phospho-L-lactate guanylyltransferase [Candidatus Methanoxibalbensis ujae]